MSIPASIPLAGGASPWVILGPVTALSVAAGWLLSAVERRVPGRAKVRTMVHPTEEAAPRAA